MSEWYFDKKAADNAIIFIERHIRHVKGEWASGINPTIKLEKWQKEEIIKPLVGWKSKKTGLRKYRYAYIEIPRKNSKSTLCAALALLFLALDNEEGKEVYSAAGDRAQAGIVFDLAKIMVQKDPMLSNMFTVYKHSIFRGADFYQAISADVGTKHGFNANIVIFDELHTQPNRDLFDVLKTSMASRRQPMFIMITTAGYDMNSICYEQHQYAKNVIDKVIEDDRFLPVIYAADPTDDPFSEATWKKANPNYGVSVKPDYIREEAEKAKKSASYLNTFLRLHLNIWTTVKERWITEIAWDNCHGTVIYEGEDCYGGLDLSSVSDVTAFTLVFRKADNKLYSINWFWLPEEKQKDSADKNNINYLQWVKNGLIKETPGNAIDYDVVFNDLCNIAKKYNIKETAYDPYNRVQIIPKLQDEGFNLVEHRQGFVSMNVPVKTFETKVLNKQYIHDGNPVLKWMLSNCIIDTDTTGNIKVNRKRRNEKIDGIITNIMAVGLAEEQYEEKQSYLETEDMIYIEI